MTSATASRRWVTSAVIGICRDIFLRRRARDGHGDLPLYLGAIGLGAAALGAMEGFADLAFSLSKLAGGWVGHHTTRTRLRNARYASL